MSDPAKAVLEKMLILMLSASEKRGAEKLTVVSLSYWVDEAAREMCASPEDSAAALKRLHGYLSVNPPGRLDVFSLFEACTLIRSIVKPDDEPNLGERAYTTMRQIQAALHASPFTFALGDLAYDTFHITNKKGHTFRVHVVEVEPSP